MEQYISEKFTKKERLRGRNNIKRILNRPFFNSEGLIYSKKTINISLNFHSVLIIVKKSNISNANERNLLKRRIREAYRKNKYIIYDNFKKKSTFFCIAFIYNSSEVADYTTIEQSIINNLLLIKEKNI